MKSTNPQIIYKYNFIFHMSSLTGEMAYSRRLSYIPQPVILRHTHCTLNPIHPLRSTQPGLRSPKSYLQHWATRITQPQNSTKRHANGTETSTTMQATTGGHSETGRSHPISHQIRHKQTRRARFTLRSRQAVNPACPTHGSNSAPGAENIVVAPIRRTGTVGCQLLMENGTR